jgi:GLPGLI family protein
MNMKHILLLIGISLPIGISAQELEGTVRYLLTHNWSKKFASEDHMSKQAREREMYIWGSRSEWKEFAVLHLKPNESKYLESEEKAEADMEGYSWRKDLFFVKRNFSNNTTQEAITMMGKTYLIEDQIHPQNWKILNDLKEVAGHVCMKAFYRDTLKKQDIVAWFAMDLPHSGGPERFCGLPGLILEVDINNGSLNIAADKIELKKLEKEMELPAKMKGKKVNEDGYLTALRDHFKLQIEQDRPTFWGIRY